MSNYPLVSILMPAYNAEKFISEAIESIIEQDHPNWELLILDDASTDATLSIIRTFEDARIKVFQHEKNFGYLLSCNELFEKAKGEFVSFLDADDTCASTRISACVAAFETDGELQFVTTDHIRTDELGKVISENITEIDYTRYASHPNYYPTICCATIFLKSELLKRVGAYHPFFKDIGGEDYHWLFRLSRAGKGKHLPDLLYNYRQHSGQIRVQNKNPLKYFAADIDQEIRNELILGNDPLLEPEPLRQKWLSRIQSNPSELHFRMASEALNRQMTGVFFTHAAKALFSPPPSFKNVRKIGYLLYSFFARIA